LARSILNGAEENTILNGFLMKTIVFVISDLHLGGDSDFRICGPKGQRLLKGFLGWVAAQADTADVHLVVNGDSVDFLAEREFSAFTATEEEATTKLRNIFRDSIQVWDGFAEVVKAGCQLTFLLGNHDLELSLPGPRRVLLERLGPGRVEFIYDNQALAIGDVLVEHGNQYDRWNKVDSNGLREFRADVSRRLGTTEFKPPPGSQLVHEIMNEFKPDFHFVNLLKPENQAAIPILGILRPGVIGRVRDFAPLLAETWTVDTNQISGCTGELPTQLHPDDEAALKLAEELSSDDDTNQVGGSLLDTLKKKWHQWTTGEKRKRQVQAVGKALRHWMGANLTAFDTGYESPEYKEAAEKSARAGFRVVTYGHTHLAKRIPLIGGTATYLNSGTWTKLMFIPNELLLADEGTPLKDLEMLVDDLVENHLDNWVGCVPTFIRFEMEDGKAQDPDVWWYGGPGRIQRVPDGRLSTFMRNVGMGCEEDS
jgi:UDP-2,3-diacylglucosamine pyrophosphatase LpxH